MKKNFEKDLEDFLIRYFKDPRREHGRRHKLSHIVFMAVCAILADCVGWNEVADYCKEKEAYFKSRLPSLRGIPSHDTFNRVFSLISPKELERAFREWMAEVGREYQGVVAVDGKTIRNTGHWGGKSSESVHVVSAWACGLGLSLGQEVVEDKSNEIPATQELLEKLDLKRCTVTADALNCQRETVELIRKGGGDYILALKNNHKNAYKAVAGWWDSIDAKHVPPTRLEKFTTEECGHGRKEKRVCEMYSWGKGGPTMLSGWQDVHSLIRIRTWRTVVSTGETSEATAYFISSLPLCAEHAARSIRQHWSVENNLHWQLDVSFNEDDTRKRGNAIKNWSLMCKIAMAALKRHPLKCSLKLKKKKASWNPNFLDQLLEILFAINESKK